MVASEEAKAARALSRAMDARSFNVDHFVAMVDQHVEVQKVFFTTITHQLEVWASQEPDTPRSHPTYPLIWASLRMVRALAGSKTPKPTPEPKTADPFEGAASRPLFTSTMHVQMEKRFPDGLIRVGPNEQIIIHTGMYVTGDPKYYKRHRPSG